MNFKMLSVESKKKGVHLLGTGDCLHPKWLSEIKHMSQVEDGIFEYDGTTFVLTCEVEDYKRVHHLIIFPAVSAVDTFISEIKNRCTSLESDGRPKLHMDGREIAQISKDVDALIGPSHAFTPWTGIYAMYNSIHDCYEDLTSYVSFIELGLSADSDYADRIKELENLTFLTNSDAHSPYPSRLAREFNRFKVEDITFTDLKKALLRCGGREPILNVGLPPQEGKYNKTACIKCYKHYTLNDAKIRNWRCDCTGRLKKGVSDRVEELATYNVPRHPSHRPPYMHLIPLVEIIAKALHTLPQSKTVFAEWNTLVKTFGNEVNVLVDKPFKEIEKISSEKVSRAIAMFRENKIIVHPGGGGRYGIIELPTASTDDNEHDTVLNKVKKPSTTRKQKTLFDY
jgi:uncharacterized protein (TIGR00375 family)